jgi:hypothetical protein
MGTTGVNPKSKLIYTGILGAHGHPEVPMYTQSVLMLLSELSIHPEAEARTLRVKVAKSDSRYTTITVPNLHGAAVSAMKRHLQSEIGHLSAVPHNRRNAGTSARIARLEYVLGEFTRSSDNTVGYCLHEHEGVSFLRLELSELAIESLTRTALQAYRQYERITSKYGISCVFDLPLIGPHENPSVTEACCFFGLTNVRDVRDAEDIYDKNISSHGAMGESYVDGLKIGRAFAAATENSAYAVLIDGFPGDLEDVLRVLGEAAMIPAHPVMLRMLEPDQDKLRPEYARLRELDTDHEEYWFWELIEFLTQLKDLDKFKMLKGKATGMKTQVAFYPDLPFKYMIERVDPADPEVPFSDHFSQPPDWILKIRDWEFVPTPTQIRDAAVKGWVSQRLMDPHNGGALPSLVYASIAGGVTDPSKGQHTGLYFEIADLTVQRLEACADGVKISTRSLVEAILHKIFGLTAEQLGSASDRDAALTLVHVLSQNGLFAGKTGALLMKFSEGRVKEELIGTLADEYVLQRGWSLTSFLKTFMSALTAAATRNGWMQQAPAGEIFWHSFRGEMPALKARFATANSGYANNRSRPPTYGVDRGQGDNRRGADAPGRGRGGRVAGDGLSNAGAGLPTGAFTPAGVTRWGDVARTATDSVWGDRE